MEKITKYEFTEQDKKLLATVLPDNPCDKCSTQSFCCGCSAGTEYNDKIKPYKDAGILDIVKLIKHRSVLNQKLIDIRSEIEKIDMRLIDEYGFTKLPIV